MKRFKKFLTPGFILLFFGSLALGNGFLSWFFVPRKAELQELSKEIAHNQRLVEYLQKLPIPDVGEDDDVLPRSISVGSALSVIERAAKEAGIRSISFGTQRETHGPAVPRVKTKVEPGEPGSPDGGNPGKVPEPKTMACTLKVQGRFQALLRFLGTLESSRLLMQVVSLDATPSDTGVKGEIGLKIFFYPGKAKEKTGG